MQDWQRALEMLAALPEDQRAQPQVRLALGRAALAAGQHEQAVAALRGLDAELPVLKSEARRWYVEAAAVAGPHEEAAKLLAESARVQDLILAAQAFERAGKAKKARDTVDRAVKRAQRVRSKREETDARMTRAELYERGGKNGVALVDWRWVVTERPTDARARVALAGIRRLEGRISLDAELAALRQTTTRTNLDETLKRLDALAKDNKPKGPLVALVRGQALYQARSYARARDALDYAAALVSPFQAEAHYYAGRAAERAADPEGAQTRFDKVMRRFPQSGWAERSTYHRAQLLLHRGKYDEATKAFTRYLSHFGASKWAKLARMGHALAQLSNGKPTQAKETFVALRKDSATSRNVAAQLRQLEGVAALRAGRKDKAGEIWLELIREQPLTFPAMAAHARLKAMGHEALPALIGEAPVRAHVPLAVTLPTAPAMLHSLGLDDAAERRIHRAEQELAARFPGRESESLCAMYGMLVSANRRQRIGNRAASFEILMKPPSAAERWAWSCVYPQPYAAHVTEAEKRHDVPAGLVHAIMRQESAFRSAVISPAGAQGLMQLMPNTAARAAAEIDQKHDPAQVFRPQVNIELGTFYIGKLLKSFGGSVPLAVAAYNAGPLAVRRWLACTKDRDADLWVARIPYKETRNYVGRVLTNFARYQYLTGGREAVTELTLELPSKIDIGKDPY